MSSRGVRRLGCLFARSSFGNEQLNIVALVPSKESAPDSAQRRILLMEFTLPTW